MNLKNNSVLIKTIISIAIPFILFLFIFYASSSSLDSGEIESTEVVSSDADTQVTDSTLEDDFTSTISEDSVPTDLSSPNDLKIGDTANFNGVEFTLENAYLYDGSDTDDDYYKPDKGMTFLVLDIKVKNNTSEVVDGGFRIDIYADGKVSGDYGYSDKTKYASTTDLLPNTFYEETETYLVPVGSTQFQLRVRQYFQDEVYVYSFNLN